jgi:hypothetical protein
MHGHHTSETGMAKAKASTTRPKPLRQLFLLGSRLRAFHIFLPALNFALFDSLSRCAK